MLIQHPAEFGGYRHCGSRYMNILANTIIIFSKADGILCASRVSNNNLKNISYGNVFSVSNEISPILVTCFLGNECRNIFKRTFINPLLKHRRRGGEKKTTTQTIAKFFALDADAKMKNNDVCY